jgi:hypothetical protein
VCVSYQNDWMNWNLCITVFLCSMAIADLRMKAWQPDNQYTVVQTRFLRERSIVCLILSLNLNRKKGSKDLVVVGGQLAASCTDNSDGHEVIALWSAGRRDWEYDE